MTEFDISFDFRNDSICGDPDCDSLILYDTHKSLWRKELPSSVTLSLETLRLGGKYGRFVLKNNLFDNLSSDRMCPHYVGKYSGRFDNWLSDAEKEDFKHIVRTIGGHIVFPAHKKNGFTINQARGVNRKICDRFDLTLECIRLFYINKQSPLHSALIRYNDFFHSFKNFKNYIDFFLLQDFVDENYLVKFSLPHDNFLRSPLPLNMEEYRLYRDNIFEDIRKRNARILKFVVS